MKFYGIDMQGKLYIEEADINPATTEYDRRFVRDTDGRLYVGRSAGGYLEIISNIDYTGILPANLKTGLDTYYHQLGGNVTETLQAPDFIGVSGTLTSTDTTFLLADGVDLDTSNTQASWVVGTDGGTIFYDGADDTADTWGLRWKMDGPDYSAGSEGNANGQVIATREYVLANFLQGTGTGVGSGTLGSYYTKAEADLLFLADAGNANARNFANYRDNVVYTNGHIASKGFGVVEARTADTGGTAYNNGLGANHVVLRNGTGNIFANVGYLTATSALYADLAEKYTCDETLPVGTVVAVSTGTEYEVAPFDFDTAFNVVGVVSENPAYLMNSESAGLPIALTGRVPVRVVGEVRKGDFIVASAVNKGCAIKGNYETNLVNKIGIVLETNLHDGEKLVECIIK